jgi:hypothetical protein
MISTFPTQVSDDLEALRRIAADPNAYTARERVLAIEREMRKQPQLDLPLEHIFSDGVYARKLFIPKGVMLTGQIHKYQQLNILLMGDISVLVGDEVKRLQAPFIVVSPPGTKRIAYAHEDTIWLTILATRETDVAKIEHHFVVNSEQEYLAFCEEQKKLAGETVKCLS